MVEPLALTVTLVKSIVESLGQVTSNFAECQRVGCLAKRTLVTVSYIEPRSMVDRSLSEALGYVNEVLNGAQAAIDDCCKTNCLCALLLYKSRSFALKQVVKELDHALIQIPLQALTKTLDIQDNLATSSYNRGHEGFDQLGYSVQRTRVMEIELKEVSAKMDRGFRVIKEEIISLTHQLGLSLHTNGVLTPTINMAKDICDNVEKAKTNKEGCIVLVKWVKQTLAALKELEGKEPFAISVLELLKRVNKALYEVKQSIDDCSNTDVFHGVIFSKRYSLKLKEATGALEHALCMIPWELEGIPLGIQSSLATIYNEIRNIKVQREVNDDVRNIDVHLVQANKIEATQPTEDDVGQFSLHLASSNNSVDMVKVDPP